jgi:hypothetical protein
VVAEQRVLNAEMRQWLLWMPGRVLRKISGLEPRLASWNANSDLAQIRLREYLDRLAEAIGSLPSTRGDLFLHMDIDVRDPACVLRHHDLENYLTPVVCKLGPRHFSFVSARKQIGGGSRLVIGMAEAMGPVGDIAGWGCFSHSAGSGPTLPAWKSHLRTALAEQVPRPLPPGPVEVHVAWRCSSRRNWVWLWKPTGDAMGPLLGEPNPQRPFNPSDDRITVLGLHLNLDDGLRDDVDVGIWWKPVGTGASQNVVIGDAGNARTQSSTHHGQSPAPRGQMARITWFIDDDAGYLAWISEHPAGFVVNCYRRPTSGYLKLHRATCRTVRGVPARGRLWTKNFVKICAASKGELEDWARCDVGGRLEPCGSCKP